VYSRVITGELLELGHNKPLAQGTRLSYIITGYLNKETSSDTEINPILVKDRDDLAGPNAAYEPTKDSKRQSEISLDDERINSTNSALMDHKIKEPPQLKEGSTSVNDLLGGSYTIRPRADRHHSLIESTPQWAGECSYPKVLNMTTPNKSSSSQVGNSTRRSVAPTAYENG